ncbi:MAG TPA: DNA ligase D [Gemmatimonadales bacterium]|nr:DNA ligase D [Gemmatimonadales bacterium]
MQLLARRPQHSQPEPITPHDPLAPYRAKRTLDRTPEPAGARPEAGAQLFVVHKHAARRLHYDLRLELDGVLVSWAVPKGPSPNPADKRLAVHVEDHPLEYGDFEGIIPAGNYGAGGVIVWDRGRWTPIGDPRDGLAAGKLLFELDGFKLHGRWTLVKIKKAEKEWLLIKERDAHVASSSELPEASVLSGLTVEEVKEGRTPAAGIAADAARLGAPNRVVKLEAKLLMLAETADAPFSRSGWVFELKLDGYRVLAGKQGDEARLLTRNGNDCSVSFPEVERAVRALPVDRAVLDGEVVALDADGKPSFQRLQGRAKVTRAIDVRRAVVDTPVTFFAFDLLSVEGYDLRQLPLTERKALLSRVVPASGVVRYLDHFETDGKAMYEQVQARGLEGIIAKKADSPYRAGRSSAWLKMRTRQVEPFVVVGFTEPRGSRGGFGALHVARDTDGDLVYAGRVGSGFSDAELRDLRKELESKARKTPPCSGPVPKEKGTTWVDPELECEVEYAEITDEGLLRQPVLVSGVRKRARAGQTGREQKTRARQQAKPVEPPAPSRPLAPAPAERVQFTNRDKIYWPNDGYTKGDLIDYYRAVAPWLLPYLADRPVVLTRFPDGIEGKSFYQKDAPPFTPEWVRTATLPSEERDIDYIVVEDIDTLLYLANLGSIPLHIWGSRVSSISRPDWCVLDLDPKEAPFTNVVKVARAAHALCERIELPHFVKTSGSSGLHVMIPLGRQLSWDECRSFGELLARMLVDELPDIATVTRQVSRRGGKVYVDYLQNIEGQLIVAPFSVRPLPGAPVSTPLEWREVTPKLDIRGFTMRTVPKRLHKRKRDPLAAVLTTTPDLGAALAALGKP